MATRTSAPELDLGAVETYYRAALLGLRRLDTAGVPPKRFDASADARWQQVQGNLTFAHRVDLLLRDASFRFGAAFHAGSIFDLAGLTGDEPFGPTWPSLRPQKAKDLWTEVKSAAELEPAALIARWADLLGVAKPKGAALARVGPAEQVIAFGSTAAWHAFGAFQAQAALDWSQSVLVVADEPRARQFAGLLAVVDPAPRATRLERLGEESPDAWAKRVRSGLARLDRVLLGSRASDAERAAAETLSKHFPRAATVEVS